MDKEDQDTLSVLIAGCRHLSDTETLWMDNSGWTPRGTNIIPGRLKTLFRNNNADCSDEALRRVINNQKTTEIVALVDPEKQTITHVRALSGHSLATGDMKPSAI